MISPGEEIDIVLDAISDCKSYSERGKLLIVPASTFAQGLEVELLYVLLPQVKQQCLLESHGPGKLLLIYI